MKRYLATFAATAFAGLAAAAGVNWFVDPYALFDAPRVAGLNRIKTEFQHHVRLAKAGTVRRLKPRAIVLGTSRAEYGLDPDHPGWATAPVYNLALPAPNTYEMLRYFQHANAVGGLERVVLAVDFFAFNVHWTDRVDFDEARLAADPDGTPRANGESDLAAALLSWDALRASFNTIRKQHRPDQIFLANGQREWTHNARRVADQGGHRRAARISERSFARQVLRPRPRRAFALDDPATGASRFPPIGRLIEACRRDGIDLAILISPAHARQWELLRALGLWPAFEDWKRRLTGLVAADAAAHPGQPPVAIWDFSGYDRFSTEAVPPAGDAESRMTWYWDSSHYKKELGDLVLDRVFGYRGQARGAPEDFGVRLSPETVEGHLAAIRAARERWAAANADIVDEISKIAAAALAKDGAR